MRCPQCGIAVSASASRCPACNRTLGSGATGGLTPAPDAPTVFLPPGGAGQGPERVRALSSDDDGTRLGGLESAPTQLGIGGTTGSSDEDSLTRLVDDDAAATMLATPPGTRAPAARGTSPGLGTSEVGPLKLGEAFGTRYHIIRLLGIGGMGAVYQAWDEELGVVVAIKVIRPEAMADPGAAAEIERRFKRELLLARQVTHKNVVRIHDLGEVGGIKYITMPFVDGEDLATIATAGRLPIARVLQIARAVTSGLVAAHAAGVVHRDLKPANIMVDAEDEAMIMDFGIARSTGGASRDATLWQSMPSQIKRSMPAFADATMFGAVVGTVAYMAPEQAKGQSADQRADIYAFGLILYDLLVGRRRADHAVSSIAELQGRMEKAPPPARSIEPDIPEAVDRIVTRCIEPDPAKRYQTTVDLEAELNRLDAEGKPLPIVRRLTKRMVAAAAALLLAGVGTTYWLASGPVAPVQHEPLSVLIADFDNRANDPVFHGTIESALSIALEGASFITSYRREEAQRAVEQIQHGSTLSEVNAILLAVREGIKVVLSGSIEQNGSGYTLVVKAIDPAVNKVLGSASAKASSKGGVLPAVGSLAANIRGSLGDETPASAKIAAAETVTAASLEALQSYTRGQELQINSKYRGIDRLLQARDCGGREIRPGVLELGGECVQPRPSRRGGETVQTSVRADGSDDGTRKVQGVWHPCPHHHEQLSAGHRQLPKIARAVSVGSRRAHQPGDLLFLHKGLREGPRRESPRDGYLPRQLQTLEQPCAVRDVRGRFRDGRQRSVAGPATESDLLPRVSAARDGGAQPVRRRRGARVGTPRWGRSASRAPRWPRWAWPTC